MKLIFTFSLVFLSFFSLAQRIHKWGTIPEPQTLLKEYKENFVILKYAIDYHFGFDYHNKYSEYYHIKVNQEPESNGLVFHIGLHEKNQFTTMSLRLIKSNGDVEILNNSEINIKRLKNIDFNIIHTVVVLENIEKGDEVEFAFEVEENEVLYGKDFWGYKYYPSLKSSFRITNHSSFPLSILSNMDHSALKTENKGNYSSVSWDLENTPGLQTNQNLDPEMTNPYVSYMLFSFQNADPTINYSDEMKTKFIWTEWYTYYKNKISSSNPPSYNYKSLKSNIKPSEQLKDYNDADVNFLQQLVKYYNANFEIKRFQKDGDKYEENNFDRAENLTYFELLSVYYHFLKKSKLKFDLGMAVPSSFGQLNENAFNAFRISSFFFKIYLPTETIYLFPSDPESKYELGEIPMNVQGTKAALFDTKLSIDRFSTPEFVILNQSKSSDNKISIKNMVSVDSVLNEKINRKINIVGDLNQFDSTLLCNKLEKMYGFNPSKTYARGRDGDYNLDYTRSKLVSNIGNQTLLIELDKIFPDPFFPINEQELDAMMPLKYQFKQNDYFLFQQNVELVQPEVWKFSQSLEYYSINYQIHQLNENTILFQMDERFTRKYLSKEEMNHVVKIRKDVEGYLKKGLQLKLMN
ncbi:MAG: hypothetical protein R2799_15610 [Crocinitomicaceae bacterium]